MAQPYSPRDDERNHMQLYGTFKMDSIHGRLFELQVYIDSLKWHTFVYFAFVIIALLLWPIAALLAIPVGMIAGKDRELQMFKVILVLATCAGLLLWLLPAVIVSTGGGVEHFKNLIYEKKEINLLDFVDFFLSELMFLLIIVFSWVYHDISLDTEKYKWATKQSWTERQGEYGTHVAFPKAQLQRLRQVLDDTEKGAVEASTTYLSKTSEAVDKSSARSVASEQSSARQSGRMKMLGCLPQQETPAAAPPVGDEDEGVIDIHDVVRVLEALPGWQSSKIPEVTDHLSAQIGEDMGLFAELAKLSGESKAKKIWPIDIWLTKTQFYPEVEMGLTVGLNVALNYTKDLVSIIISYIQQNTLAATVLVVLAMLRTMLPRLWLWAVLDGELWPKDIYGPGGTLVFYSTCLTFVVSLIWLGLFYVVLMEYRRTLCQMTIITALVDARMRVKFSQSFLMSCMWFGMDSEQSEAVLSKLPLLDLRKSSNAAAFWRLREYCTLDRCNERMAMSVLLEIVIIWLLLKFVTTLAVMFAYGGLPAILIVTLFDLLVFGGMTLFALQVALQNNSAMEMHKQSFVEAKYEVTMAYGQLRHGEKDNEKKRHDLDVARRLLTEYLDMTNESDLISRDSILFGMMVTPGKIVSSLGTVAAMVATLLLKMVKNGAVKPPASLEKEIAQAAAKSFLSIYSTVQTVEPVLRTLRAWHVD